MSVPPKITGHGSLVVLVPTDASNGVPGIRLVAQIALLDAGMLLTSHYLRDHVKMPHVVTGRGLMTLHAIGRGGRWMLVAGDLPAARCVAFRALLAEQVPVRASIAMAGEAIERLLLRGCGTAAKHRHEGREAARIGRRCGGLRLSADRDQGVVVHANRPHSRLVLDMAIAAGLDRRVKCRRLPCQQGRVAGVTENARRRLDATIWRMTGLALI